MKKLLAVILVLLCALGVFGCSEGEIHDHVPYDAMLNLEVWDGRFVFQRIATTPCIVYSNAAITDMSEGTMYEDNHDILTTIYQVTNGKDAAMDIPEDCINSHSVESTSFHSSSHYIYMFDNEREDVPWHYRFAICGCGTVMITNNDELLCTIELTDEEIQTILNAFKLTETEDERYIDVTDLYTLTKNDNNTYSYSFSDLEGKILFENGDVWRLPKINQIADNIYGLVTQTGTGLSTNWAVYCDVKNSQTSDIYYYVLGAKENYVICGDYKNGEHFIVVQEIFDTDGDRYYKEYKLEDASPVAADFTVCCKFDTNGNAVVTYITGNDYAEKDLIISLP
ncbi:MAG: hypothetical protein IKY44_01050 [Clostridia bacterium]|nr:hypothetical protein [Clostridia bacterium]